MPTYSVPATYSTISAAIAAIPSDLAGGGIQDVIVDAGTYNESLNISGFTNSSSSDFIRIQSNTGHEHKGISGAGVVITGDVSMNTAFTRLLNLEIKRTSGSVGDNNGANCKFENMMLSTPSSGFTSFGIFRNFSGSAGSEWINTSFWNSNAVHDNGPSNGQRNEGANTYRNCICYGFIVAWRFNGTVINCVGDQGDRSSSNQIQVGQTTCASSDSSATFLPDQSVSELGFIDPKNGDFHIFTNSNLDKAGTDQDSFFTKDIDLETITLGEWPIGYDAFPFVAPPSLAGKQKLPFGFGFFGFGGIK